MIYFKSLTISLRYCCFYLPFLLLLSHFYIAAQPVRVDRIIEGFLGLVPCTEYTRLGYCFSFLRGTTPIFDVYFITTLNTERRLPKFERNKFILALCEEDNIINLILNIMNCRAFRQDHFCWKGPLCKGQECIKGKSPPPLPHGSPPVRPPSPSRGVEREIGTCTTKANARA